ncbi:MAG: YqgE/AlgH family protein [Bacteroidia bacterium]|nr:YqgE/AlgH family protein [Bacteroidia bacterium]
MKKDPYLRIKEYSAVETGSILIAQPFWQDETWQRSVIMIIEHEEEGTVGLLLNKKTNALVRDFVVDLPVDQELMYGGPADLHYINYIHENPRFPGAHILGNGLFLGGDSEFLLKKGASFGNINFYAGFVKWYPKQLEDEILQGKWWVGNINNRQLFNTASRDLWHISLLRSGHVYGLLYPFNDPSLN